MRVCLLILSLVSATLAASVPVDFAAKIEPLFQEHCIDCHAADEPDAEFNMESFEALIKGGKAGKAILPGNAQDSLLVKFLEGRSGKEGKNQFMPPGKKEHLSAENISLIRQWIDAGALPSAAMKQPTDALANLPKITPKADLKKAVLSLAISPAVKLVAAGSYGSVQLLNAETLEPVRKIEGIAGKVNALTFSADGSMLFGAAGDAGVSGIAYQWKVSDGSLVRKFEGDTDALYTLALSADGKTLATGSYDQKIRLWSVESGAELRVLKGHNGGVFGLSFRPDGRVLASASADRTVKLWEVATGKRLDTFSQPLKEQTVVAFAPDGKTLAAAGADNRIRVWSVSEKALEGSNRLLTTRYAHEGALLNLAYALDGKTFFTTAADRTVKVWKASDVTEQKLLEKQPDWSPALALRENGQLLLGRLDGSLAAYDVKTGQLVSPGSKPEMKPKTVTAAAPELLRMQPRGVQSGATTLVKITGKNLQGLKSVKLGHPGLKARVIAVQPNGLEADMEIVADAAVPRSEQMVSLVTEAGESKKLKLYVDDLPQLTAESAPKDKALEKLPLNLWGTLTEVGQLDSFRFQAKTGETIVLDLAARRLGSTMISPRLEVLDSAGKQLAVSNGLDSGSDPYIAFAAPREGEFVVRVREITLGGSPDHVYRLTLGSLPYVTGWWPLTVPANQESHIRLIGANLPVTTVTVKANAEGAVSLPLAEKVYRSRGSLKVTVNPLPASLEQEPNDVVEKAQPLTLPASVNGRLFVEEGSDSADADLFQFEADKDQEIILETRAALLGSPADTKLEVLDSKGEPVPMMQMQATKDSWVALRSHDANIPGIRLGQFSEMEINDYMYFNGEVLKIFRLARGPDADMIFYAQGSKRRTYFNTSPTGHGLDDACFVVEPKPVGVPLISTGLPVFTLHYANDDDGERKLGEDSRLVFKAPAKGRYHVRVSDTRGWSGDRLAYQLMAHAPKPDFSVKLLSPPQLDIPAGSGVQFAIVTDREDGWEGEIKVSVSEVPAGFYISNPLTIEAGHLDAAGSVYALPNVKLGMHDFSKVKFTATGLIAGQTVTREVAGKTSVKARAPGNKSLFMEPDLAGKPAGDGLSAPAKPFEITMAPGTTVSAWLRMDRRGEEGLVGLDVENLPHGVIVDNIGLSGVQIRAGEKEREIFLTCAPWVAEQDRLCHVVVGSARNDAIKADAAQTGFPVLLKVRKPAPTVTQK